MNSTNAVNKQFRSTYSLLVGSEEKGRGALEIAVYAVCILSVVFTIFQFAQTPLTTSAPESKPCLACHTAKSDHHAGT
jgi:hypothetical protein